MYFAKFCGLALSALMSVTPINYDWDLWQFPQDRYIYVRWYTYYTVSDVGYADHVQAHSGLINQGLDEDTAEHYYVISYTHDVYCSEACYIAQVSTDQSYSSNHYSIHAEDRFQGTAADLFSRLQITYAGQNAKTATFTSADDTEVVPIVVTRFSNTLYQYDIYFKGATDSIVLDDIANHTLNASSYLLRLTLNNMLNNRNLPSDVMSQYQTYINNGDYSTAYTYISNYINNNEITENNTTNNELNTYNTKHTDLNTYFTTENNFTDSVQTDFQTQNQNIPLADVKNEFTNPNFLKSAEWVTLRFNELTSNNQFGKLLSFSLITGFILALIGRFKR